RQLQPQLRFYYAGGIPAYATSDAFEPDPRANQDLDGLIFPDMPWMLGGPLAEAVHSAASQAWPVGRPARGRLFAFGFDAYRIAAAFRESRTPSSLDLSGASPHGRRPAHMEAADRDECRAGRGRISAGTGRADSPEKLPLPLR